MKVLIIIPAYNEANNITKVVDELIDLKLDVDYVVVNDGSTDDTELVCKKGGYSFISLPINLGIGGAVQTGYRYAFENKYDIAIQMDGDGQHDASYIPNLIEPIVSGRSQMVIGSRYIQKEGFKSTAARRFGIRLLSNFVFLKCGIKIKDVTSGFRAINSELIEKFARKYPVDFPEPESLVMISRSGYTVTEVPVVMRERRFGRSSIDLKKSVYYMIKVSIAIFFNEKLDSRD